jgi:pyruvate kinase
VAGEAEFKHKPGMIAKIERSEAIPAAWRAILAASDGIMVARGDLAVEVGNAAVPALQKRMIRMAREMDKVTITATQMMESMITNPVPTRAEVSDVANAVLDGTDAVMLSAETAPASTRWKRCEQMAGSRWRPSAQKMCSWTPTSPTRPSAASIRASRWARCSPPITWAARPLWR